MNDYLERNVSAWTRWSPDFAVAGERSWATDEITWGIWGIPEAKVQALGSLSDLRGAAVLEAGCGTAYFSAWLARLGADVVGLDITPAQLATAQRLQEQHSLRFPLVRGNAERTPFPDESFDLVFSEYGASIWCDPLRWIPECARLLKPGGRLVYLKNGTLAMLCMPSVGQVQTSLQRSYFGLHRMDWGDDESVEFHMGFGDSLRLLKANGFEVQDMYEVQAPEAVSENRFDGYMSVEWAQSWPSEEIWSAIKIR